jgi:hypothetical protein
LGLKFGLGGDNASVTVPNADNKCISGSFGAGGFAACGTAEYPHGWTQGEFTLNPTATTQEVVDISGVNGINYAVSIALGTLSAPTLQRARPARPAAYATSTVTTQQVEL